MKKLFMATLILFVVCSCKKENQRGGSLSPSENIIGKWQYVGQDPNTWVWYFREDQKFFFPATLTTGKGYHYEINDSVFTYSYYDPHYNEKRYSYKCFGDSLITGYHGNTLVVTGSTSYYVPFYQESHFFRYTGR